MTTGHPLADSVLLISALLAAALGILGALRKVLLWWWRSMQTIFRGATAVAGVMEVFTPSDGSPGLVHDLAEIKTATRELRPNGGTSMYDRLRVMEVNVADMKHDYRQASARSEADKAILESKINLLQHDIANVKAQMVLTSSLAERAAMVATGRRSTDAGSSPAPDDEETAA